MIQDTNKKRYGGDSAYIKKLHIESSIELTLSLRKFLPSGASKVSSNTRITSRRFSKSNDAIARKVSSSYFAGVDISSVVSTRGWRSPGIDSPTMHANAHGVFNLDIINVAPADGVSRERVNDVQAFIADLETWLMENQIEKFGSQNSGTRRNQSDFQGAIKDSRNNDASDDYVGNPCRDESAFASKTLNVGHQAIFAQGGCYV